MDTQILTALSHSNPLGFALLVVGLMSASGALLGGLAGIFLNVLGVRARAVGRDEA